TFHLQSEIITLLAEIGVIALLFEIGLESNLKELMEVGVQTVVVAIIYRSFCCGYCGIEKD
ncbi:cation:proton antiporter, partial [Pleurocapsales cyanobacterium LEGE 10410]|nr:cation:proton antiporter [Pleurocapsales cyanobacterium LEGE 10410]